MARKNGLVLAELLVHARQHSVRLFQALLLVQIGLCLLPHSSDMLEPLFARLKLLWMHNFGHTARQLHIAVYLQIDFIQQLLLFFIPPIHPHLSKRQHALAGDLQVVRHFHHACLQRKRTVLLKSVSFRIHNATCIGADCQLNPQPLPHRPLTSEELSEPVTVDASLAMEKPHKVEEITT